MNAKPPHSASDRIGAEDRSLSGDLRGLVEDARVYVEAEVAFQKVRAGHVAGLIPSIAILGVLAFLFVFFALGGLVVGMILALAPWLTPWGSMAFVCVALLIGALICVLLARNKWRALTSVFAKGIDL